MIKVIFYLKSSKTSKNGESPIFARISVPGEETSVSAGKSISKERWLQTGNLRNALRLEKEKIIKNALDRLRMDIETRHNLLIQSGTFIDLDDVKAGIQGKPAKKLKLQA